MSENALEGTLCRTKISEYTTPPMNALVTALPGLVIIFVLAGGVNALAGVLLLILSWSKLKLALFQAFSGFPMARTYKRKVSY